jgi:hypothetical protein
MTTTNRFGNLLAIFVVGCALIACTTQEAKSDAGGGKGGTTGSGGTTGAGGSAGGGGTGAGGLAVSNGTTCLPVPSSGLITDYTYVADGGTSDQVRFGDSTTALTGGTYYYPNASGTSSFKLMGDVTGNNFHITGSVGDYSGFGIYLDNCDRIDATGFTGLSFTLAAGATNAMNTVTLEVDTLDDTIAASWLMAHPAPDGTDANVVAGAAGRCLPTGTATNKYGQSTCTEPTTPITITGTTASPQTVTVPFSSFTTGKPTASPVASDITGIHFILPVPGGVATDAAMTYQLDLTIDNLSFVK